MLRYCAVFYAVGLCCAVLRCAVMCCRVLRRAVLSRTVLECAVLNIVLAWAYSTMFCTVKLYCALCTVCIVMRCHELRTVNKNCTHVPICHAMDSHASTTKAASQHHDLCTVILNYCYLDALDCNYNPVE